MITQKYTYKYDLLFAQIPIINQEIIRIENWNLTLGIGHLKINQLKCFVIII